MSQNDIENFAIRENIRRYRLLLQHVTDDAQRRQITRLLTKEEQKEQAGEREQTMAR
jgi:hypothetical protein